MRTSSKLALALGATAPAALLLFGATTCVALKSHEQISDRSASPAVPAVYTACLSVKRIAPDGLGGLWTATAGGVLHWDKDLSHPRRWTCADGLPSNDVLSLTVSDGGVQVHTAGGIGAPNTHCLIGPDGAVHTTDQPEGEPWIVSGSRLRYSGNHTAIMLPADCKSVTAISETGMRPPYASLVIASPRGLWRFAGGKWIAISLPADSPASHVSALVDDGQTVYAGLYGDGLYTLRGRTWTRLAAPAPCKFATGISLLGHRLAVGTPDAGVQVHDLMGAGAWRTLDVPPSVPSADIQSLAFWNGQLWAATFDAGILCFTKTGIVRYGMRDGLASDNPRALIVAGDQLYARDANSKLDVFGGIRWHPAPWLQAIPRRDVYCCSYAHGHVMVGGWGGWADIDGDHVETHYKDPALANQVVTCIAKAGDTVWIGTAEKGLLRYDSGIYTEYHEAQGVTDDWITCIAANTGRVLVGTYTGGLLEMRDNRFETVLTPERYAIRAIEITPDGAAYAATPLGVYTERGDGKASEWTLLDPRTYGGAESQCLCHMAGTLWVGGRTSLGAVPEPDASMAAGSRSLPYTLHRS